LVFYKGLSSTEDRPKYVEVKHTYHRDVSGAYMPIAEDNIRIYKSEKPPTVCTVRCKVIGFAFSNRDKEAEQKLAEKLRRGEVPPAPWSSDGTLKLKLMPVNPQPAYPGQ